MKKKPRVFGKCWQEKDVYRGDGDRAERRGGRGGVGGGGAKIVPKKGRGILTECNLKRTGSRGRVNSADRRGG